MDAFTMWDNKIIFVDGWFIYMDGNGNNSIISHRQARTLESEYQSYQAWMDVNKGGDPEERAFGCRGFTKKDGKFIYEKFRVDQLIVGEVASIPSILQIPRAINGIKINYIMKEAFKDETAIEKVILHEEIHTIGESAFEGCLNLCEVAFLDRHIEIRADAFIGTKLFSSEVSYLNKVLYKVDPNFKGALKVKEGTLAIADEALCGCTEITRIDLPDGLISIGDEAFTNCSGISALILPESVRTIGRKAFAGCTNLAFVVLPEGIEEIERATFFRCENLYEVNIPKTVRNISFDAFEGSGLFTAYEESNKNELYLDEWLIHYKYDKISSLHVKGGTVGIADMDSFKAKTIDSVTLPDSLKYIGDSAFKGARIESVILPQNLLRVGMSAFHGTKLKEVSIPKSVSEIKEWAFMNCDSIQKITVEGIETKIVWPAITGRKDKKTITICARIESNAKQYCAEYGERHGLVFLPWIEGCEE